MKKISFLLILLSAFFGNAFAESDITSIEGFAPKYIGEKVEVFIIEDYFSLKEKLIATAVVKSDSTFKLNFFNDKTQKIIIKSKNNKGFMYIQPKGSYHIYFPIRNRYDEYRPLGNDVEISFNDLPENDINFKILEFDRWKDNFLGLNFYKKNINGIEFVQQLDTFKINVEKYYAPDTSFFLKTYVRFSIASLDEIQFAGTRNRFEKYDFYLKKYPVMYDNNLYMEYVNSFYKNIYTRLTVETNNRIYLGVLKSSPTMVANALSEEITLRNVQLLELVMIKSLGDSYFNSDFPQTNIITILDSISKNSLIKQNGVIAANMISKLTEILPGSKAPDFSLMNINGEAKTNENYFKKHLYIQFIDFSIKESEKELELLKPLYTKYKEDIEFITIYKHPKSMTKKQEVLLKEIAWEKFEVDASHEIFKRFKIDAYPSYVLIDAYGYIVSAPALKPTPNGQYETIDKPFFFIQKLNKELKK